jgi:hypothetical protein
MTTRRHSTADVRPAFFASYERKTPMLCNSLRILKLIALLTLGWYAFAGSTLVHAAAPPTPIDACGTISTPGNFVVTKNLTASGDCLTITASNVNIDLKGHKLTGDGTGSGITGNNLQNIVINDGKIKNFATGINLTENATSTANDTIQNMNVSNNTGGGIHIVGCCNTFANVTANNNGGAGLKNDRCCSTLSKVVTNNNGGDGMDILDCCYVVEKSTANGNTGSGILSDGCCSAVNDTVANNNHGSGLELEGCCSMAVNDVSNHNGDDGVFFNGCCGDLRGNNIAVNSTANSNGANGFEFTDLRNSVTNVVANKNATNGVFMTCPATESGIAAKANGSANLAEDSSNGVCTDLNNKAP